MMNLRTVVRHEDAELIKDILESTGFFYDYEIKIALEITEEFLTRGAEKTGYFFLFAEEHQFHPMGFAIYGPTPCTSHSFDLYWIGVHKKHQGKGIGKLLLNEAELHVAELGGKYIWIETSSRPLYEPTRNFYLQNGYIITAQLPEFYGENDDKVIFSKKVLVPAV